MKLLLNGIGYLIIFKQGFSKSKKPNILVIISDDTAFADLEPYGSEIKTPALDELAQKGIKFTNFHATPVCSVTRSELITEQTIMKLV